MAHPGGQPTKLTPEVIEDVRRILPTVMYLESVADYLGVDRTTWRKWVRRGQKEAKRLCNPRAKPKQSEALYLEFFHTHKRAMAEGQFYDAGMVKKAGAEQWQAAAWRLERRFPKLWGRKDGMEVTGKNGGPLQITNVEMTDAERLDAVKRLEARVGQGARKPALAELPPADRPLLDAPGQCPGPDPA